MKKENDKNEVFKVERDDIMASVTKPNTRAFRLRPDKVDQFLEKKGSFDKIMERFQAHKPKKGVVTPSKGKHE